MNLRLDPFERANQHSSPPQLYQFYAHEFWRFVFSQQQVAKLGKTFVDDPPMQKGASFNLERVKEKILKAIKGRPGN